MLQEGTERRFYEFRHTHCSGGRPRGAIVSAAPPRPLSILPHQHKPLTLCSWPSCVQGAVSKLARRLLLAGGLVAAAWLAASASGVLKDEVKRREAVRRVKHKVARG